jgi:hypothetical protein
VRNNPEDSHLLTQRRENLKSHLIALMEAASTSETSVNFYQTTRRSNPEDTHLLASYWTTSAVYCGLDASISCTHALDHKQTEITGNIKLHALYHT